MTLTLSSASVLLVLVPKLFTEDKLLGFTCEDVCFYQ